VVTTVEVVRTEACNPSFDTGNCEVTVWRETDADIGGELINSINVEVVAIDEVGKSAGLDTGPKIIEELAEIVEGDGMFRDEIEVGEIPAAIAAGDDDKVAGGGGVNGGLDNGVAAPRGDESGRGFAMEVVVNTEDMFNIFSMLATCSIKRDNSYISI
jgi:hypothetical protein